MRWCSALSGRATLQEAFEEVASALSRQLATDTPDLVLVYCSAHHGLGWHQLAGLCAARWPGAVVVGSSGGGVLAEGVEVEEGAALSIMAGMMPGTVLRPIRWAADDVGGRDGLQREAVVAALGPDADVVAGLLLFADPFSTHTDALTRTLDDHLPYGVVVGALASGGDAPGRHALFLGGEVFHDGAVAVAMSGDVQIDAVVAQGCRPVDMPRTITRLHGRMITELDTQGALGTLEAAFDALDAGTRKRFRQAPMVGVAMDARVTTPGRGDFLVRHLVGVAPKKDAFTVGHPVREGDIVQFHVRDAATSVEDLHELVARHQATKGSPAGVWMFSCMGRGQRLYGQPHVDSRTVRELLGEVPMAGFFGNGEIGPVHGRTFVHGYTCVVAMIRAAGWN